MFGLFKRDPKKQLHKRYDTLLEQARDTQRSGDVVAAAKLYEQADAVYKEIQALDAPPEG